MFPNNCYICKSLWNFYKRTTKSFHMKKHELRIKSNVNCNIYIDTEYTCSAEANHFAKIELDEGEYMIKVENVADPDDYFFTEILLDRDRLIKPTLNGQSDTDSKNEPSVAVSKDKNTRDDARGQKPSTALQISEIVESLAKSKAEDKSQSQQNTNQGPSEVKPVSKEPYADLAKKIDAMYPMVEITGGTFFMGEGNERHQVTLSPYQIGTFEVTQELWEAVMGDNHSAFKGARKPVTNVSWSYCQEFIKKLNQITGKDFRLPTEAEWEFAARGGVVEKVSEYSGNDVLNEVGWSVSNSRGTTHDVGEKNSNKLGLYDMSGNVNEWCLDWYGYYLADSIVDPIGPKDGYKRIARGGSWKSKDFDCGVTKRYHAFPHNSYDNVGLRLCVGTSKGNISGRQLVKEESRPGTITKKIDNVDWKPIVKGVGIVVLAILIVIIADALGIKLPPWVLMMLKNL